MEKPTEEAPEAGKEQEKAPEKEKKKESLSLRIQNSKVVIWIGIISAVLGIVGFVQAIVTDSNKPELSVSLNYHNRELQVGQADTLLPTVKPEEGVYEYIWKSDNETAAMVSSTGVVRLLAEGSATITLVVKDKKGETVQASCLYLIKPCGTDNKATPQPITAQPTPTPQESSPIVTTGTKKPAVTQENSSFSNVLDLGFATYEGGMRNGQPHGNGTMTFRMRHLIPGTVDCEAASGEKVIGSFREGKINMGTWYRNDGSQALVKLGQKYGGQPL